VCLLAAYPSVTFSGSGSEVPGDQKKFWKSAGQNGTTADYPQYTPNSIFPGSPINAMMEFQIRY